MMPSDRPTMPAAASDLALLRRFEPVVRYTKGEPFFPTDVEQYVRRCSLWVHSPDGEEDLLVPEGEMTMDKLVEARPEPFGTVEFLRFIHPLTLAESARVLAGEDRLRRQSGNVFHAGQGRLARGGLLPRVFDAGFSASLLLRGTVPGATSAAAELEYARMQEEDENYVYHGRVVRHNGWTILQYWFFYVYNSWRSGFDGVNDHEADWETILVYLYEEDGHLIPEWVGYASHDFHGADLRRRWDDREQLELWDGHPVVYAGAGSHAAYFVRGEYQAEVSLPAPAWLQAVLRGWHRFWTEFLGQPDSGQRSLRIPFVDYARGDGLSIGPGQAKEWTPNLIDEQTPWVSRYRGLWGLFARDPISGENAPAGPMVNRDGTPRGSWFDPLGFAGLDKVPPPPQEMGYLRRRRAELDAKRQRLADELTEKALQLQEAGAELRAMEGNPHLVKVYKGMEKQVSDLAAEVTRLRREQSQTAAQLDSLDQRISRLQDGESDAPRAHIGHLAVPVPQDVTSFNRLIEAWAAVSISLLLLGLAALIVIAPLNAWLGAVVLILAFVLFEAVLRRTYAITIGSIAVILALVSGIILVVMFWKGILIGGLILVALTLLFQKLRDLRD